MNKFAIYNSTTGEINRIYSGRNPGVQIGLDEKLIVIADGVRDTTHYILNLEVVERPTFNQPDRVNLVADGIDKGVTLGLPDKTQVTITGDATDSFEVTDDILELTFDTPGKYNVVLKVFPYQNLEVIYIAL